MPRINDCQNFLGRKIFVLPYYGYGWGRQDLNASKKTALESLGPEPFFLRLGELVDCNGQIMGVSGIIDQKEHEYTGFWCCCLLRNPDECDLTEHAGDYQVWIAQKKLPIHPAPYPEKALGQWIQFNPSEFCLCGFGMVAESVKWVKEKFNLAMFSRQLAKEES